MIGANANDCPFCLRIQRGDAIMETARAAVVYTERPRSKGHCLIVPKSHVKSLFDLPVDTISDIWELTCLMKAQTDVTLGPTGWNLRVNVGHSGGQTVWHAHIHLVPQFDQLYVSVDDL